MKILATVSMKLGKKTVIFNITECLGEYSVWTEDGGSCFEIYEGKLNSGISSTVSLFADELIEKSLKTIKKLKA
jgi:hypothetical protein